jgi:AAA15 family ATPase/GTPase
MLIRFEVENFLSFKDRQQLSMIADKDDELAGTHCVEPESDLNLKLLKSAVIFGANASGKSNLLKALLFMRNFINESTKIETIKERFGFSPFKLDQRKLNGSSFFEISFLLDKIVYIYGFKIDSEKVFEEWLYFYPRKKKVLLFKREIAADKNLELSASDKKDFKYHYKFGNQFRGEKNKLVSLTRDNSLYLSVGAQFAHPILEKVFFWFKEFLKPGITDKTLNLTGFTINFIEENDGHKKRVVSFLKSADLGIEDISIEKIEKEQIHDFDKLPEVLKREIEEGKLLEMAMTHRALVNDVESTANINFTDESSGTLRMFQLAGPLFYTLMNGGVLIIDELEDSLHIELQKKLLTEFFKNSKDAQIIFTSHNLQLLDEKLFRRDEIWFTEKKADGGTDLFSLADFKPKPRKDKSIKNGYLTGAYGALPILGDLLSE